MGKEEQLNNATVAATLAKDIKIVAEKARNEEELRIGVEKLLEPALQKLGIAANPRYEHRISRTLLLTESQPPPMLLKYLGFLK